MSVSLPMETPDGTSAIHVGTLEVRAEDPNECGECPLYHGKELLIGRDCRTCNLFIDDPTISNRHLKVYSVIFDQNDQTNTEPLVYAEDLSSNGSYWNGSLIGKGNGGVLLSDGDEVRISPRVTLIFEAIANRAKEVLDSVQELEKRYFSDMYAITNRKLGAGGQGQVYMAVHRSRGRQLACKIVDLRSGRREYRQKLLEFQKSSKAQAQLQRSTDPKRVIAKMSKDAIKRKEDEFMARVLREVDILKELSHPNVIRLEKVYQTENTLYIFEELFTGGDLYSYIEYKGGNLSEAESAVIVRQVLEGLKYLHAREIVHRDLKPDNLLIVSVSETARVVLTDFGCATQTTSLTRLRIKRMETLTGTLEYRAPEVTGMNRLVSQHGYTKAVDMWSLGCVTAALLTGASPFAVSERPGPRINTHEAVYKAAAVCRLDELEYMTEWQNVSPAGKEFVNSILELDESARMTAPDALEHRWFTNKWHKELLDRVYDMAVRAWRPSKPQKDIVETIKTLPVGMTQHNEFRKPRGRKQKDLKPIEPHYRPYHKFIDQLVSPSRSRTQLSSIAEVAEDWEEMTGGTCKTNSNTMESLSLKCPDYVTDDSHDDLPAIETLQLTQDQDPHLSLPKMEDSFARARNQGLPSRADLLEESLLWDDTIDDESTHGNGQLACWPDVSASHLSSVLNESESTGNIDVPQRNIERAMEIYQESTTPSRGQLKRPTSVRRQRNPFDRVKGMSSNKKRKPSNVFDIEMDEEKDGEGGGGVVETHESGVNVNTAFTPINRRHSILLGDFQSRDVPLGRKVDQENRARPTDSHDGPLVSKQIEGGPQNSQTTKRKYSLGHNPKFVYNTYTAMTSPEIEKRMETDTSRQTPTKRRRTSIFDYEEDAIYVAAGKENRQFRTARSFGQSVKRKRAERAAQAEKQARLSGDLTDSIRTAY